MRTSRRGTTSITVAALAVAVLVLASSTAYFAFFYPRPAQGNAGGGSGNNQAMVKVPAAIGSSGGTSSGQVTATDPPANSITVSGTGQVSYIPNEALVGVSVVTNAATAGEATTSNAATTTKVIKALNSIGVDNSSIQTQGFTLYPNYANNYGSITPQAITSFTVTNSLLVNLTSSSATKLGLKAGQAIDTSVAAGANQISLTFAATSSLLAQISNEELQQAVASAAGQAQTIARSLENTISGVISAVQGYSYNSPSYPYYSFAPAAVLSTAATPIIPGTQTGSATVTVVYSIS